MSTTGIYTADGQYNVPTGGSQVTPTNPVTTTGGPLTTSTQTNVPSSTSSTQLITANANRGQVNIINDGTAVLYILYGTGTASSTNYTFYLTSGQLLTDNRWKGAIQGVWSSVNGNARVSEQS